MEAQPFTCGRVRAAALAAFLTAFPFLALAQGAPTSWELAVCAPADNLPYSNAQEEGFENGIVQLLAHDLNAELRYIWLPPIEVASQNLKLLEEGSCDVFLDAGDNSDEFLTTLPYVQTTYYLVYRSDAPFRVTSLDDEALRSLKIGVVTASPPDEALGVRGLTANVRHYSPDPGSPETRMIEDVATGIIDVAVAFGPFAGPVLHDSGGLVAVPVAPEFELYGLSMVYPISMGVRHGDTDLRDLLNASLARQWGGVVELIEAANVLALPLPTPLVSTVADDPVSETRIGVVVPTTGDRTLGGLGGVALAGAAAARGAQLAADELLGTQGPGGSQFRVLISSAPTPDAMVRAAARMVSEEGAFAVVGGFTEQDARMLGALAQESSAVFLNISAQAGSLRQPACAPNTFHVAPSAAMYVAPILDVGSEAGYQRWFIVSDDNGEGRSNLALLEGAIGSRAGLELVGRALSEPLTPLYSAAFAQIAAADPDVVVLLLSPNEQLTFMGQYATSGSHADVIGFPAPAAQSRQYYAAYLQNLPDLRSARHIASWEATLDSGEAEGLNERFLARNGVAMDPAAWAAYAGVKLIAAAALEIDSTLPQDLIRYLEAAGTVVDVQKGPATVFGPSDHQLRQPLYLVESGRDYQQKTSLMDLARLVRVLESGADPGAGTSGQGAPGGAGTGGTGCR